MGHTDPTMVHPYDTLSSLFMKIIRAEGERETTAGPQESNVPE